MQAILFCDKMTECIPMQDTPEALLPICNVPLLAHLLNYLEKSGFTSAVLLGAGGRIRRMLDGMRLQMPVREASSLAALHAPQPTLLLRRLCLPEWDMGELYALCAKGACRLCHADGTQTFAELHPTGSALLEPREVRTLSDSRFLHADTPADYRRLQQQLLASGKWETARIGEGLRTGKRVRIDAQTIIGADCILGDDVRLEGCVLGDGVQIGAGAQLRDCIICRNALVDHEVQLEGGVIPEGTVLPAGGRRTKARRFLVLPEDGICEGVPRWNTAHTALRAGAGLTALGMRLAVGYSAPQGQSLALAAASGAVSQGAQVWYAGECALSQLIDAANRTDCAAMLWASGEHPVMLLPFGRNGTPLTHTQNARLRRALEGGVSSRVVEHGQLADVTSLHALWEDSVRALLPAHFPEIRVSCANPMLRAAAERLFSGGEGEQLTLTVSEDGTRASVFGMEAGMLREEQLLLLAMLSLREMGEPAALPADLHPAALAFAEEQHCRILPVQDEAQSPAAFAAAARQGICTDGVRLFAHVLRVLDARNITLRQAAALLPKLYTVKKELETTLTRQAVEAVRKRNPQPGVSIHLPPQGRLLRVRVHADSMEAAAELCGMWEKKLRNLEKTASGDSL